MNTEPEKASQLHLKHNQLSFMSHSRFQEDRVALLGQKNFDPCANFIIANADSTGCTPVAVT